MPIGMLWIIVIIGLFTYVGIQDEPQILIVEPCITEDVLPIYVSEAPIVPTKVRRDQGCSYHPTTVIVDEDPNELTEEEDEE